MKYFGILSLASSVFAFGNGSPTCSIDATGTAEAMGNETKDLGYTSDIKRLSKNEFEVSFANTAGRKDFQGLLMYIGSSTDPKGRIGKFAIVDTKKFKFQDADKCSGFTGAKEATVTHANDAAVPVSTKFKFTLTDDEMKIPNFSLQSVIASGDGGSTKWQILESYPVTKQDAATTAGDNNDENQSSNALAHTTSAFLGLLAFVL